MKHSFGCARFLISFGLSIFLTPFSSQQNLLFSFLAPATQNHSFKLNPSQKIQAQKLIRTLEYVCAFPLPEPPEMDYFQYQKAAQTVDPQTGLIPRLWFYQVFGTKNLRHLQKKLKAAVQKDHPLPTTLCLKLNRNIGLYPFLLWTRFLSEEEEIFDSLQLCRIHRRGQDDWEVQENFLMFEGKDILRQRLAGFRLYGEKAAAAAAHLFSEEIDSEKEFKETLLNRTEAGILLIQAVTELLNSITPSTPSGKEELRTKVISTVIDCRGKAPFNFGSTHNRIDEIFEEGLTGKRLKERLGALKEEIEAIFALGSQNGKITYLNLLGLTQDRERDAVITEISHVTIQLKPLLQIAQHPEEEIVREIGLRLVNPEESVAGAYEANLSQTLASFPKAIFHNQVVFYNLLEILTRLTQASPILEEDTDRHNYISILQKNILWALQQAYPKKESSKTWFAEALAFLDDEKTFKGMVAFLAATGWIDAAVQTELQKETAGSVFSKKVKRRLEKGEVVVTKEQVSLHAFNSIKRHIFFSTSPSFYNDTDLALAFLKPAPFFEICRGAKNGAAISSALAQYLAAQEATTALRGLLYRGEHRICSYQGPARLLEQAALFLVDQVDPKQKEFSLPHFASLLQQLPLTEKEKKDFLRALLYSSIRDSMPRKLNFLLANQLMKQIKKELNVAFPSDWFQPLKKNLLTLFSTLSLDEAKQKATEKSSPFESIASLFSPLFFVNEFSQHFGKNEEELQAVIPALVPEVLECGFLNACFNIQDSALKKIDRLFNAGKEIALIWNRALSLYELAPLEFLNYFDTDQNHFEAIRETLDLKKWVRALPKQTEEAEKNPMQQLLDESLKRENFFSEAPPFPSIIQPRLTAKYQSDIESRFSFLWPSFLDESL